MSTTSSDTSTPNEVAPEVDAGRTMESLSTGIPTTPSNEKVDASADGNRADLETRASADAGTGEPECGPTETECVGDSTLRRCASDGRWSEPVSCPYVCASGACTGICEPGNVGCSEDNEATTCNADGEWEPTESCSGACEQGACVSVCTEGRKSCAGKVLNECSGGEVAEVEACEFVCDETGGACAGVCVPNEKRCIDGLLATCGADGQFQAGTECSFACVDDDCGGVCKPDQTQCKTNKVQQTCSPAGDWVESDCEFLCSGTTCSGECSPGARRCVQNGTGSQLCNESGQWDAIMGCVEGCQNDQCVGLCDPGTPSECLSTEARVRSCEGGQWITKDCEFVCTSGACGGVCQPGTRRCQTGRPQLCSTSGQWQNQTACSGTQVCESSNGQCLSAPTIAGFTSTKTSVTPGGTTTLSWVLTGGAATVSISPNPGAVANGTTATVSPTQTTTYTLTASNAAGTASSTLRVAVVPAGVLNYVRHFGSSGNDIGYDLALDSSGRLITLGHTFGSFSVGGKTVGSRESFLAVHNLTNGAIQSLGTIPADDNYLAMAIDAQSNIFLAGAASSGNGPTALARYNPSFVRTAYDTFTYYPSALSELASDVAVRGENVFAVGEAGFAADGYLWRTTLDLSPSDRDTAATATVLADYSRAVAVDAQSNVFVGGFTSGEIANPYATSRGAQFGRAFIAKYTLSQVNADPDLLTPNASLQQLDEDSNGVNAIVIDSQGSVIFVWKDTTTDEAYIAKYSNNLQNRRWETSFGASTPTAVAVDEADNVIVGGSTKGNLFGTNQGGEDAFIVALTAETGAEIWANGFQLGSSGLDTVEGIVASSGGDVFVVGTAGGPLQGSSGYVGGDDAFLLRIK